MCNCRRICCEDDFCLQNLLKYVLYAFLVLKVADHMFVFDLMFNFALMLAICIPLRGTLTVLFVVPCKERSNLITFFVIK